MNGKGDSPRPVDRDRFESNYDEIKWNDRSTVDCKGCQVGCGYTQEAGLGCVPVKVTEKSESIRQRKKRKEGDSDQG